MLSLSVKYVKVKGLRDEVTAIKYNGGKYRYAIKNDR